MSSDAYDPVTTTDFSQLTEDEWGLQIPNIRYGSYRPSRLKTVCNFVRDRFRLVVVIACLVILFVILAIIIGVATQNSGNRKPSDKDKESRWENPDFGLVFYPKPEDGSTVIQYVLKNSAENPIYDSLKNVTQAYHLQHQLKTPTTVCTVMNNPPDKTCLYHDGYFGSECVQVKHWGYPHATPCVLVQLNLPENVTIKPIPKASLLWPVAEMVMKDHADPEYVPFTCQGKTMTDRLIIGFHGYDSADGDSVQYSPPDGFPSFFYRPRNFSLPFIKPGIMVRLTSLKDDVMVHIECVAWGQLWKNGKMMDHKLLKTSFAVYIKT